MATDASFLIPPSLHIAALLLGEDGVTIRAISEATDVRCPICGEPSDRVHSRSERTLGDLPWARFAVHLHVEVRRFVCANPTCPRQIFAEHLEEIAPAFAHRTDRQRERLTAIALVLGGEAGARLAAKQGMPVSPDTLLRLLRAAPEKERIDPGQAWQSYIETHFEVMRRMADYHLARATSWDELRGAHARFVHDYNHQPHAAYGDCPKGRRSPAFVLGWVHGAWCDPADLDRLFRLRATRVLNTGGAVRFRHWRLYGERGLAGERAAAWLDGETLTVEYATEALAQYGVAYEADGRRLREVDEPRLFPTRFPSPQPFLPSLDEVEWHPVQRLAPYQPQRTNSDEGRQRPLFDLEFLAASG